VPVPWHASLPVSCTYLPALLVRAIRACLQLHVAEQEGIIVIDGLMLEASAPGVERV
jgi:hypothetical protein